MISIATDVEITRENAYDVQDALAVEEQQLRAELEAAIGPAERAEVLRRYAINQERQALAWERRPGRTRDKQEPAARCRHQARLSADAADIEQLRADTAKWGRDLPDPTPLLHHLSLFVSSSDEAVQTVLAVYTAAADSA